MLEDCLVESRSSARTRTPLTLVLSVLTHGGIVGLLVVVPLFSNQVLPQLAAFEPLPPPTVTRAHVELVSTPRQATAQIATVLTPDALIAPQEIPREIIRDATDAPVDLTGFRQSFGSNGPGFPLNGILGGNPSEGGAPQAAPPSPPPPPAPPRPPDPPPAPPAPLAPVRYGGEVLLSKLVHQVTPVYPPLARTARAQGTVILEAVVTRQGTIDPERLRVIAGHPLLTQAAVDAVKQWRYQPTLLNGQPIEIVSTITLNFSLN